MLARGNGCGSSPDGEQTFPDIIQAARSLAGIENGVFSRVPHKPAAIRHCILRASVSKGRLSWTYPGPTLVVPARALAYDGLKQCIVGVVSRYWP